MTLTGSNIRAFRERAGMTQAALANLVGVQPNTAARWERNEVRVPEPTARLIRLLAILAEDDRGTAPTGVDSVELLSAVWLTLSEYLAGQQSSDSARTALKQLRRKGRRGRA